MPPTRTKDSPSSYPSSSAGKSHHSKHKRSTKGHKPNHDNVSPSATPGVQKIKGLLRQARRLLKKDKLAADVRQATERKIRALEKDLADAERARKERTMATRYHKIKFFERQKVTRKISQVKRQLGECSDKTEKKSLKRLLLELRVDLNYIQHYPKTKKYISLFPPEVRGSDVSDHKDKGKSKDDSSEPKADTDAQREALREQIREMMERGELSAEPETETSAERGTSALDHHMDAGMAEAVPKSESAKGPSAVEEDAFFGNDSDESEGEMDDS
ncbi:hypothetical protein BXZ70DRAFT_925574 [Cristinia sonorae]|uniref:rRNA-processing protein EFG1 n=1 Tax=Cristinia sonorae TaxID=1940300 RepID=A0A8K0XST1_9AGAR|nr:hypothetical protein BXZ70DRAFT_925574 [Cristinia sonorae]